MPTLLGNPDINNLPKPKLVLPDSERIRAIYILSILHAVKKGKDIITVTEIRNIFGKTQYYSPYEEYKRKAVRDLAEHQPPLIRRFKSEYYFIQIYFLRDDRITEGSLQDLSDLIKHHREVLKELLVNKLDVEDVEGITTFLRVGGGVFFG